MSTQAQPGIDPTRGVTIAELFAAGVSVDQIIARMRSMGMNKIDSIKIVREHKRITLGEAKDIVHLSPAWEDRLDSDNRLHDELIAAAESHIW